MSEQLMNLERLRLRAIRCERQTRAWKLAAWVLLILLGAQTWLVVDTAIQLKRVRQAAQEIEVRAASAEVSATQADAAFRRCRSANADLIDGIKEQQVLLREAIEQAKRCRA